MTDEEWEEIKPLVEAYQEAQDARSRYLSLTLNISDNRASYPQITRAGIEAAVANEQSAIRLANAKAALESKCASLLGTEIRV